MAETQRFRFGEYEVDLRTWELRRGSELVPIQPRPLSLLVYLIRNRERVIPHHELLQAVWPRVHVEGAVLKTAMHTLRRALQEPTESPRWISSARGRGYRFHGDVQILDETAEPEVVARAAAAVAAAAPAAAPPPRTSDFVGREAELEQLRSALAGEPYVALLHGPPGVGKTRTAQELAHEAAIGGAEVYVGRTYDGEGALPFWPWIEILRRWFETRSPDERAQAAADFPALGVLVPEQFAAYGAGPVRVAEPESQRARFLLFDEVANFLRAASARRPLLLVLDDLHWADEGSLALLLFLARHMLGFRGLILGTHRDGLEDGDRSRQLASVLREHRTEAIALRGLAPDLVERMLGARIGAPLACSLGSRICEATGGNPFFVLELAKSLPSDDGAKLSALEHIPISERLRGAVSARIRECSPVCQQVLRALCVEGAGLELTALRRTLRSDGPPLLEALGEATAAGYVVRDGESYRLAHDVVRETLYQALGQAERLALHRAVGEALEATAVTASAQVLGQVAHHFTESAPLAQPERAIAYAERAAQSARNVFAYADAAALYRRALRALEFVEQPDEAQRCSLLIALGDLLGLAAEPFEILQGVLLSALERARAQGLVQLWATAAERCAVHMNSRGAFIPVLYSGPDPVLDQLRDALEAALPKLTAPADERLRVRVLIALYMLRGFAGEHAATRALVMEAASLTHMSTDAGLRGEVLLLQWDAGLLFEGDSQRAQFASQLLQCARDTRRPDLETYAYIAELYFCLERGDRDGVERVSRHFDTLARSSVEARCSVWVYRLLRLQLDGDIERAEREAREISETAALDHWPKNVIDSVARLHSWWIQLLRGNFEHEVDALLGRYAAQPIPEITRLFLARLCAHCGRHDEARAELDDFERKLQVLPEKSEDWLFFHTLAAEICSIIGERDLGAWLFERLAPYAGRTGVTGMLLCTGSVARPVGSLAALLGRWDESESHFATALAHSRSLRSPVLTAMTELDHAAALLERGRAADVRRARALLASASTTATALSLGGLLERARALEARVA